MDAQLKIKTVKLLNKNRGEHMLTKEVRSIIELDEKRCVKALNVAMVRMAELISDQQKLGSDIRILEEYRDQLRGIIAADNDLTVVN